jgi:cytochrome c-type biogenesis protein CcmH
MFWIISIAITAVTLFILLRPLLAVYQKNEITQEEKDLDLGLRVYRDQLAELDRQVSSQTIDLSQAEAFRLEINRRILSRIDSNKKEDKPPNCENKNKTSLTMSLLLGFFIVIAMPTLTFSLYHKIGSPQLKAQPFKERQNDPVIVMTQFAKDLAMKLKDHPESKGYATLAQTYFSLDRFSESIEAYHKALDLGFISPEMFDSLGEAHVQLNQGKVSDQAKKEFQIGLSIDRQSPRARFFLGLYEAQHQNIIQALAIWRDLELDSPSDAPWTPMLKDHLRSYAQQANLDGAPIQPQRPKLDEIPQALQQILRDKIGTQP